MSYSETTCLVLFSVKAVYPHELMDTGIQELWGIGKRFWKSFDKESKEHVGKVEGRRGPRAWGRSVASKLVLEEKDVFVCRGAKSIQGQC